MYKKQLLKVKHGKRWIGAGLLSLMLMGSMGSVFAGNIADTTYNYNSSANGFATETRDKVDDTSSYIWHKGNQAVRVKVCSAGVNYTYGREYYKVEPGDRTYLMNLVKESGRNNCYLYITPDSGIGGWLYGQWSPDSI